MRILLAATLVVGLCACDGSTTEDPDAASPRPDGAMIAIDAGADAGPSCTSEDRYADCDGDGVSSADAAPVDSCTAAEVPPCGTGSARWVSERGDDCDDDDPSERAEASYRPDCDGDGFPDASAAPVVSCGVPDGTPPSCGLGEVGAWTDMSEQDDCDDHDLSIRGARTWFVDCDGDGFAPAGLGMVSACSAPAEVPTPCGAVGSWTDAAPVDAASTDCLDADADARPGQDAYFDAPTSAGDFDYNCDGAESSAEMSGYSCSVTSTGPGMFTCTRPPGERWQPTPACGEMGTLVSGCTLTGGGSGCRPATSREALRRCR